jgi:diguanylate cyclase (GGDEF)-like protein
MLVESRGIIVIFMLTYTTLTQADSMDQFLDELLRRLASIHIVVYAPAKFAVSVRPVPEREDKSIIDDLIEEFLWPMVRENNLRHPVMNRVRRKPLAPLLPYRILVCPLVSDNDSIGFVASLRTHMQTAFTAENLSIMSEAVPQLLRLLDDRLEQSTGLLSRVAFESEVVRRCQPSGTACVVYANLDRVHVINELAGFSAGDQLIRDVGKRWRSALLPSHGLASHLSGDRFAAVLLGHTLNQSRTWAEEIRESVADLRTSVASTDVSISLGVAALEDAASLQHALAAAEAACRVTKDRGRNRVELYAVGDHTVMRRHEEVYQSRLLLDVLETNKFVLYAQPIVKLEEGVSVQSHEVLLRVQGDGDNLISIAGFIASAERYQLLERIDRWVVSNVVKLVSPAASALKARGFRFTVNVTGQSIGEPEFADFVSAEMRQNSIPPGLFDFEITETAAFRNPNASSRFISRMTQIGSRVALDDFGTGLSSLVHLKDLDVYRLKIDGRFVRDVLTNARSQAVIRALVQIAQEIGMETVAEFVETAEIADSVKELGVSFAQGYFYGRPRALEDVLVDLSSMSQC